MKLLLGADIANSVQELLKAPDDERIVVVAFVGKYPLRWLENPRGIKLYCWPNPGATHPDGIRALLAAGVEVHFVPRLHAKIYWSRLHGAVLGSANLSNNALSEDGLHEAAVRLAPGELDIAAVLCQFEATAISCHEAQSFGAALAKLDIEHAAYVQRNGGKEENPSTQRVPTFGEWIASPFQKRWQINYLSELVDDYPHNPDDKQEEWPYANSSSESEHDALQVAVPSLEIKLNKDRNGLDNRSKLTWWYPELMYKTESEEYKDYPFTWVCKEKVPSGETVPFQTGEAAFRDALKHAIKVRGDKLQNVGGYVDPDFLDAIIQAYRP
ncbi:phospholipase D family protein [Pseudoduganella sp. OTU4001]|uniref:phospholipase D family protein n=1 Tax=Pseudoduganella sp. OTU4001 TaxID=3043854 RepID=UPI00313C0C63